ncbi:hypothetical protein H4R27_001261 [Coemansia aciculifera]|nr:hypothetical protein H4R27_001261 [Coemansia aciculifera]
MIDPDDNNTFGWVPEDRDDPDQCNVQYGFLISVPLCVKREMFRTMSSVLRDYVVSDMFHTPAQMQWAVSIIRFGLQLPLESIGMISDAFKQYSDVLFILNQLDFEGDETGVSESACHEVASTAALGLINRPGIIFNPRVFFEDELPTRRLAHRFSQSIAHTPESLLFPRPLSLDKPKQPGRSLSDTQHPEAYVPSAKDNSASASLVEPRVLIEESDDEILLSQETDIRKSVLEESGETESAFALAEGSKSVSSFQPAAEQSSSRPRNSSCVALSAPTLPARRSSYCASPLLALQHPPTASRIARAVKLWDKYVELLADVMQVYSTVIRGLKPTTTSKTLVVVFKCLLQVVDMILSQGGSNPRLARWINKYRPLVGPEYWDKTWATIGDRLEPFAIKLAFDIWGRSVNMQHVAQKELVRNFEHWMHRDKVMEAWLRMVNQVALRVLRAYYPHDKNTGCDKLFVHFAGFSTLGTTSNEDAREMLQAYVSKPVKFKEISSRSYLMYANTLCSIINNALDIAKVISVAGVHYAQMPPTTNFALSDFGIPLYRMAMFDYMGSRDFVLAKRSVIALICRLFTMPENPKDPTNPSNRAQMLRVIYQAMSGDQQAQIMLPNVPQLIKNLPQARVFIPALIDLVRQVLPTICNIDMLHDECALRRSAFEALSTLISYVGYYHQIGRSDLIAETNPTRSVDVNERIMSSKNGVPPIYVRNAIKSIAEKIDKSPFKKSKQKDQIFVWYVRFIFRMLMCSVLTEKTVKNLHCITSLLVTHLHQYARYNPGFLVIFVELYVEQFLKSRDERISAVYINGLNLAATVTWQIVLTKEHHQQILALIVRALSSCDQDLRRYTHWSPYHQVFINSIRCLSSWTSVSVENSQMPPEYLAKLMALLVRCNKFLGSAIVSTQSQLTPKWGRKIQLSTSTDFEDPTFSPDKVAAATEEFASSTQFTPMGSKSSYITSYTLLGLFGNKPKLVSTSQKKESYQRVRTLSESLYKALTTTVEVFSTIILRSMDSDQHFGSHAPSDILLTRMSLYQNIVPDNRTLLKACKPEVIDMLKDYVPVCINFYSCFRRAIYSKISFKRNYGGQWSDSASLLTARYPSGSKQWLVLPSMPLPDHFVARAKEANDKTPPHTESSTSSHWVRNSSGLQYCRSRQFSYNVPEAREQISSTGPLVDEQSELAIENIISNSFCRLHGNRDETEVPFAAAHPAHLTARGNLIDRAYLSDQHAIDAASLQVSESMLKELDILDSMDRPFSTQVGIVYLRSPDSLLTNRDVAKGPLKGVGPYFNQFLNQLSLSQVMPVERLKQHPDDPALMRYSFCVNNFQVCYSLAPNVSSLISGTKMGPKDNQGFYNLMRKRGVSILWFDSHPGNLNEELAWQFLNNTEDERSNIHDKALDVETPNSGSLYTTSSSAGSPLKSRNELGDYSALPSLSVKSTLVSGPADKPAQSSQCRVFGCKNEAKHSQSNHASPHRSKAREFFQKAMHITRRHAADHSDSTLSQYSSTESSIVDTVCDVTDDADIPERCRAHSPESSRSSGSPVPLLEALEAYVPSERPKKKWTESTTVPPTPNVTPVSTPARLPLSSEFSAQTADSALRATYDGGLGSGGDFGGDKLKEEPTKLNISVLIALAPLPSTGGRLIKVALSATGGPKEMNADFIQMTGPLMTHMVIESKNLAYLLSATVLDASANIASLNGDDFSVVYKRISMIKDIVETYCVKHESVDDVHKFIFPVGKHGLQNTLDIPYPGSRTSPRPDGQQKGSRTVG